MFQLTIPPLRERKQDLEALVPLFVAEFNAKAGKRVKQIPDAAWRAFRAYDWPGNVRELRNLIERCVLLADDDTLPLQWLGLPGLTVPEEDADTLRLPLDGSLSLEDMERRILLAALQKTGGNVTAAARLLKTSRETLRYRVQKFGLEP